MLPTLYATHLFFFFHQNVCPSTLQLLWSWHWSKFVLSWRRRLELLFNVDNSFMFFHVVERLPEENLFHGGYWSSVAGNTQLLSVHLQFSKQQLKPDRKNIRATGKHFETQIKCSFTLVLNLIQQCHFEVNIQFVFMYWFSKYKKNIRHCNERNCYDGKW